MLVLSGISSRPRPRASAISIARVMAAGRGPHERGDPFVSIDAPRKPFAALMRVTVPASAPRTVPTLSEEAASSPQPSLPAPALHESYRRQVSVACPAGSPWG